MTCPGFRRDFFIWALSFIKILSNHVGNFRKAVVFIVVEYIFKILVSAIIFRLK
nr:MAG TPA: hypothetical protein [Caudoviricetes sp.]